MLGEYQRKKEASEGFNAAERFVELCFSFLEEKISAKVPREKKELIGYIRANYSQFVEFK